MYVKGGKSARIPLTFPFSEKKKLSRGSITSHAPERKALRCGQTSYVMGETDWRIHKEEMLNYRSGTGRNCHVASSL